MTKICREKRHWVALFTVLGLGGVGATGCLGDAEDDPAAAGDDGTDAAARVATAADASVATSTASYAGWNRWTGACNVPTALAITEPAGPGRHPLFIYAIGTLAPLDTAEGALATAEMARRGFVAAVLDYDTVAGWSCAGIDAKASCAYAGWRPASAVATLCRRANVDCSRGIVVGGLSQGAAMAVRAANAEPRVRAAWVMGFGGGAAGTATACYTDAATRLASDRLRVVNGRGETSPLANLNAATGMACWPFASSCLRADGSGWDKVEHAEVEDRRADHCYFVASGGCTASIARLDAGWVPPADASWSLATNLDWLAGFAD